METPPGLFPTAGVLESILTAHFSAHGDLARVQQSLDAVFGANCAKGNSYVKSDLPFSLDGVSYETKMEGGRLVIEVRGGVSDPKELIRRVQMLGDEPAHVSMISGNEEHDLDRYVSLDQLKDKPLIEATARLTKGNSKLDVTFSRNEIMLESHPATLVPYGDCESPKFDSVMEGIKARSTESIKIHSSVYYVQKQPFASVGEFLAFLGKYSSKWVMPRLEVEARASDITVRREPGVLSLTSIGANIAFEAHYPGDGIMATTKLIVPHSELKRAAAFYSGLPLTRR